MIKKVRFSTVLLIIFITLLIQGCSNSTNKNIDSTNLTYMQYVGLINKIYSNFTLENFIRVDNELKKVDLIAIDKKASFNKRTYLTLDGQQTADSTQRTLTYKDNKNNILSISIIYLNSSVGNDLVYMNLPSDLVNSDIIKHFDDSILSYKNILLKVTLFTNVNQKAVDTNIIKDCTLSLVDFLKDYVPAK